jgi:hypothetical protein
MRTLVLALALAVTLAGRMAAPVEARAQRVPPRPMSDTIAAGFTLGAGLGTPVDGGAEAGLSVDVPLDFDFRARGDLGFGLWRYDGRGLRAFGAAPDPGFTPPIPLNAGLVPTPTGAVWIAPVPETEGFWFEIAGVDETVARRAFSRVAYKMPVRCRFVKRRHTL